MMTSETARTIICAGLGLGSLIWLVSVIRSRAMFSPERERRQPEERPVEMEGNRDELTRKIAALLTSGGTMFLAPLRVTEAERGRVLFHGPSRSPAIPFISALSGEFFVNDSGSGKVKIGFRTNRGVEQRAGKIAFNLSLFVGLPVMVLISGLLLHFVVPSDKESVRSQAFQILQTSHVLWPPFLIQHLGRRSQSMIDEGLGRVIDRLRFG